MKFEPGWSAVAWCSKENEHKEMDVTLAVEIERVANQLLAAMLKECPKVYGRIPNEGESFITITENPVASFDTHTARLVDIQKIGEKP